MDRKLITSALLYANGQVHLGHIAGAYLPADIYARFERLIGNQVLFLSGSDEYGLPITLSAEKAGKSPQEHVDHFHEVNSRLFSRLSFSFDYFGRTTSSLHKDRVLEFFHDLQKNGYIESKEEDHLYSESEGKFLADRYVEGTCPKCGFNPARGDECPSCGANYESIDLLKPRSKLTGSPLIRKKSRHYYLRFDAFKDRLTDWVKTKNWKENVYKFSLKYIEDLRPRAITRDSNWGIPIALDTGEKKVFYVWFDAPIGYISIAQEWARKQKKPDAWKEFWCDCKTELIQFIGKDNIPFHSVFFPAMLMGQDQPYHLVDELPANEFLRLEGKKFSKSDGNYIDLSQMLSDYQPDQIRYYLAANAPETSDADFTWKDFQATCNADLVGKLGNFIHRVLVFTLQHGGGDIPKEAKDPVQEDTTFKEQLENVTSQLKKSYKGFHVREASSHLMKMASLGNSYFNEKAPWKKVKQGLIEDVQTTLFFCFLCIQRLALYMSPILPTTAEAIWRSLGYKTPLEKERLDALPELPTGALPPSPKVLFQKIEDHIIEKEQAMLEKPVPTVSPIKEEIDFSDFTALDLRVAKVLSAEKVAKSKKLLALEVDIGIGVRKVVSGIALHVTPEEIIGKKVLFVANLKPAKIMGIQSEGMILAAGDGKDLEIPKIVDLPAGAIVS